MLNEKENATLLIAGFTQREISTQKQKFYNLFRVETWLVPMRKVGEWQGLTDEEIEDACWTEVDQRLRSFARAIEAKLKEKNT